MARRYYSSTAARTTITGSVTNTGTSITVAATTGFPSSYPWSAILDQDTASEEVVEVTAAAGTTLTIVRGVDGTTAVEHNSGATFNHGVSARDYSEANAFINGTAVISSSMLASNLALTGTTTVVSPTAGGSTGVRQITASTSAPTGGADGDVWLVYV